MQNTKINPEQAYQTFLIIWFSLLISQILFLFIVFFVKPALFVFDFSKPFLDDSETVIVFIIASIPIVHISLVLKKKFLRQSVERQNVGFVQTAMIVGCAMSEVISMFGLLLAFAYDYQYFFLFSAAGIAATLLHFPRRSYVHAASTRSLRKPA